MEPYQERVVAEKAQLDQNIEKLEAFLSKATLSEEQMELLRRQYAAMQAYSAVLGERIATF